MELLIKEKGLKKLVSKFSSGVIYFISTNLLSISYKWHYKVKKNLAKVMALASTEPGLDSN